jgi:hypothetical protein
VTGRRAPGVCGAVCIDIICPPERLLEYSVYCILHTYG